MFSRGNKVIDKDKFSNYTNFTITNRFTCSKRFNLFTTDHGTNRFKANTAINSFTNTNISIAKTLANRRRKKTGLLQLTIPTVYKHF